MAVGMLIFDEKNVRSRVVMMDLRQGYAMWQTKVPEAKVKRMQG